MSASARIAILLLLGVVSVRAALLDRDFIVNSEGLATGWVLSSARNHVRYGIGASGGAGILNSGDVPPAAWVIYAHHPPLTTWTAAVPMALFGEDEWTARLAPALFSVATTLLIFALARRSYGDGVPLLAAIAYAFCPMTLALGDMAEYTNAPLVFFAVGTVGAYVVWWERGGASRAALASTVFALAALSDWPTFYLVPILAAHAWLTRRASLAIVIAFCAVSLGLFLLLAWWMLWAGGDVSVWHQLSVRTRARVTFGEWFARVIVHHQGRLHTWPVLLLAAWAVVRIPGERMRGGADALRAHWTLLLLLAWGWTSVLVAVDGNVRHEWWSMVLTPGLALGAGVGAQSIGAWPALARRPLLARGLAVLGVAAFVAASASIARDFTARTWLRDDGVDLKALGSAIRSLAAPAEGVATTVETTHGALWFYADRQLRVGVTSVEALNLPGPYRLFSRYVQSAGPPPTWFVMPAVHEGRFRNLVTELDRRYSRVPVAGAAAWRLR